VEHSRETILIKYPQITFDFKLKYTPSIISNVLSNQQSRKNLTSIFIPYIDTIK
jgi:hypothetical protein